MSKKKKKEWVDGLEDWGSYMAAKKAKLEDQFKDSTKDEFPQATNLFKGIAIFVNGYTIPCADDLKRLMMEHGGIYHHYLRSGVTSHLIASNLPYTKIVKYRKSKSPLPLCKPEWITDSIKANKLLDWRRYLLYDSTSVTQPALRLNNKLDQNSEFENNLINFEDISHVAGPSSKLINPLRSLTSNRADTEISNGNTSDICKKKAILNHDNYITGKNDLITKIEAKKSHGTALCSKDEEFLTEFFKNSRLHHISAMGATFKEYVHELRSKNTKFFPGLERLVKLSKLNVRPFIPSDPDCSNEDIFDSLTKSPLSSSRKKLEPIIMHIDMDCFFVSVGLRDKPEFRGLPVAVTHASGHKPISPSHDNEKEFMSMAEIASCSYEARAFGIKNGMFLGQALKLCPNLKTIKYDFEGYQEVSYSLYNVVASYTLEIEAVSCDEMYADISSVLHQCNLTPSEFATIIRQEIQQKTGCPVSTGFGSNKLQARLATKRAKPDGQFHLEPKDVNAYIGVINVRELPGVGYSMRHQLKNLNIEICSDLQKIPISTLKKQFGEKTGEMLYNACRGIDTSKLNTDHVRKSVSVEINYGIRFENDQDAREFLKKLSKEVSNRLIKMKTKGKCITLKLMVRAENATKIPAKFMGHGVCDNFSKSKNFLTSVDDETSITTVVLSLLEQMKQPADDIRGVGIQMSRLETSKKVADTFLMKFIAKGKGLNTNKSNKVAEKDKVAREVSSETKINTKNVEVDIKNDSDTAKKYFEIRQYHQERQKDKTENCDNAEQEIVCLKNISDKCLGDVIPAPEEIDDAIITELPREIKDETAIQPTIKKPFQSKNYVEETTLGSFNILQLPNVKELDMQVLIELPDNIRNEILNHYKSCNNKMENWKQMERCQGKIKNANKKNSVNINDISNILKSDIQKISDEVYVPFSQNDPDVLKFLSGDIKDEVKIHSIQQNEKIDVKINDNKEMMSNILEKPPQNIVSIKGQVRLPKNCLQSNLKVTNNKKKIGQHRKAHDTINKIVKNNENDYVSAGHSNFLRDEMNILNHVKLNDKAETIKTHRLNHQGWIVKWEHEDMLINLVNYLFSLPLYEIKIQMQTWISNSIKISDIDILSIATFLSMLPKERRIEDLHILMKTMYRCISKNRSCVWHGTYRKTVKHIQFYMQIEFNSNLILPSLICNARGCKI